MYFGDLQQGSQGADVEQLQQNLETLGYSVGDAGVDGIYGPDTAAAVRQFQSAHGLAADGIYGPLTTAAMAAALTSSSGNGATSSSPGPAIVTTPPEFGPANPLVGPPAPGTGSTSPGIAPTPKTAAAGTNKALFAGALLLGALALSSAGSGKGKRSSRSTSRRRRR